MKSVILLAMPADHARIRNVVGALNENNFDVFWNRAEPGSETWESSVDAARPARFKCYRRVF